MKIARFAVAVLRSDGTVEVLPSLFIDRDRAEVSREYAVRSYQGVRPVVIELTGQVETLEDPPEVASPGQLFVTARPGRQHGS